MEKNFKLFVVIGFVILLLNACNNKRYEFAELEQVNDWIMSYYQKPNLNQIGAALKKLNDDAPISQDDIVNYILAGFLAELCDKKPKVIKILSETVEQYDTSIRYTIFHSLWLSNTKKTREILEQIAEDSDRETSEHIYRLLENNISSNYILASVNDININWGRYYASGDKKYLKIVLDTVEFSETLDNIDSFLPVLKFNQFVLNNMAKRDKNVLNFCNENYKNAQGILKECLMAAIKYAENQQMIFNEEN